MDCQLPAVLAASTPTPGSAASLADYADDIRLLLGASRSANTLRAYRSDLRQFIRFCEAHHLPQALPVAPYVVASFISWMAQRRLKASTIGRRLAALAALHRRAGCDDPTRSPLVVQTMEGLRRTRAFEGERADRVQPMEVAMLRQIHGCLSQSIVDARDWAIVLLGFAALLRRSEVAALDVGDVEWRPDGLVLHIRRSKTDQTGEGAIVGVPRAADEALCPLHALRRYMEVSGHREGPLFRNHSPAAQHERIDPRVVAMAVKRLTGRVRLDPTRFAGHSLRAGGATEMARNGVDLGMIVNHGRWQNPQTVSRHYIRPANALGDSNPMRKVL
jgi:site-specific recombinase XerD